MLGSNTVKSVMLFRFIPRVGRYTPTQLVQMNSSFSSGPCNRSPFSCCQSNSVVKRGTLVMPRRYLAGGQKEDYILQQNTLSETEKKEIDNSVAKDFEDWVPYGFYPTDKEEDIYRYKLFMFTALTFGAVIFLYLFFHLPPRNNREWVTREAYLELERRQRLNLPLVDKDLIPADRILLPSLEELGDDYEIII